MKTDNKIAAIAGGGSLLTLGVLSFAGFMAFQLAGAGDSMAGETDTGAVVEGDIEFQITHYDPAQGGINGRNCGGSHGRMCADGGSPTGYRVTEDRTGKKFSGGAAIPQASSGEHSGSVDLRKIPLFYDHGKGTKGKAIVIPCYNKDQPFLPVDHFATTVTAPNALDLVMTGEANDKFVQCLQDRKIKTSGGHNGHGGATKIKGKIVEMK